MLRTLLLNGCRRAYTCTCLPRAAAPLSSTQYLLQHHQSTSFHSSALLQSLDKDVRGKKQLVRLAQRAREEHLEDEATPATESELQGLTEAGMTIPTLETHEMLVDGVLYKELPIVHIKATPNNTLMTVTDYTGTTIYARNTCGMEGFKHVKKSTNVAAQATGLSLGLKSVRMGLNSVRVLVRGVGAGRLAAIKGLQMGGLKIVSITDETTWAFTGQRPRKVRRV